MNIQGLIKTTLLDFPGLVASTIFLGGCNMRCPFCHNMNIVTNIDQPKYSISEVLNHLQKRKGIIEGVCITGGEPTIYNNLPDLITQIKHFGYLIKLDTNGTNPQMLSQLISSNMIDYVAMDIKSSLSTYGLVCGDPQINTSAIEESVKILLASNINYEFRTTLISEYHNIDVINDIAILLNGATNYYLQNFKDAEFVPNHSLNPLDAEILMNYKNILSSHIQNVQIRGVDL